MEICRPFCIATCSNNPLNGKITSGLNGSFGNGQVRVRSNPWTMCHGADVELAERKAISVTLREIAVSNVGFLGYVLHETPIIAQKRNGHCV